MRLFQKSLLHTGYFILSNGIIEPAFSDNIIEEAMNKNYENYSKVKIFGTNESSIPEICRRIKEYKREYGVLPRYLMDELRTGFNNSPELHQSKQNFFK